MQIKNWDKYFEGAKSRTYSNKSNCSMPCKHGLGFRKMIAQPNGTELFGAWCALIQILSRQQAPRQGYLTDTGRVDGSPLTPTDLEMLSGIKADTFANMLTFCSKTLGWIDQGYHTDTAVSSEYPLNLDSNLNLDSDTDHVSSKVISKAGKKAQVVDNEFEAFWKAYPRKVAKANAIKAFSKAKDKPELKELLAILETHKASDSWQKDGGAYIPHAATWLNGSRWLDQIKNPTQGPTRPPVVANDFLSQKYGSQPTKTPTMPEKLAVDPLEATI